MTSRTYTLEVTVDDEEIERVYDELFEGIMPGRESGALAVFEAMLVDVEADLYFDGRVKCIGMQPAGESDAA